MSSILCSPSESEFKLPPDGTGYRHKLRRVEISALLAFSTLLLIAWTFATPMLESPDESTHWNCARYIHDHWLLPHYDQEMVEGNQPPVYYLLIASVASASSLPTARFARGPNGPVRPCYPLNYDVCSSDFARFWPLRIARLITALFSVLTVLFVYMAGMEISGSHHGGILAGVLLICLPEFAFRGGNISNDGMVATTSALATYWIIRLMRRGFSVRAGTTASLCVALAFLSKISAIILFPVLAVVLISFPGDFKMKLRRLSVLLIAVLCIAPWLIRNQVLYGDPLASKAMLTVVPGLIDLKPLWSPWFLNVFPAAMGNSLVGAFGGAGDVFLAPAVNQGFGYLVLSALTGLAYSVYRRKTDLTIITALSAIVLMAIASAIHLNMTISQPQGRYLFAGLPALAVLTATGLRGLPGWNAGAHYTTVMVLVCVSVYALLGVELPSFWRRHPSSIDVARQDTFISIPSPLALAAGPLRQGETVGQTFVSAGPNLSSIDVVVATYGKKLASGFVKLHLRANPGTSHDIASATVQATKITDNMFVSLNFPPIPDSKGRSFYFFMEAEQFASNDAVTTWISKSDIYRDGQFYRNGRPTAYDMLIRATDTIKVKACGTCEK